MSNAHKPLHATKARTTPAVALGFFTIGILSLIAALFWLGVTSVLGISLILAPWMPSVWHDPMDLLEAHAPLALFGFLWLSLLGFALKLFNMFLVSKKNAGPLSWAGWVCVNAALFAMVPILLFMQGAGLSFALGLLALGSFCYLADIVRLWLAAQRATPPLVPGSCR